MNANAVFVGIMTRPSTTLLPVLAALFALIVVLWWLPNRPQAGDLAMADARLNSVSFAPFRAGQSPLSGVFPTEAEVDADMELLQGHVRAIRTYAANEGEYDVAALARKHGLKLWQGIWLGSDPASNVREIARGIAQANAYPDVIERVVVGNEVLLRRDLPVKGLIAAIDQVRAAVRQPVTYADVWEFWKQFPQVAQHVDIVTIHLLPYWEDQPTGIDRAVQHVGDVYLQMSRMFAGKPVAIGETGWPSRGRWRDDAAPGVVNEAVFLRRFIALARAEGFDYNVIEAFDQGWKYQNEGVVGANWGLWTADRTPKFPLSGPVVENPDWPVDAAISCGGALLLLVFGLASATLPKSGQIRLAALAAALGAALGYAWAATTPDLYDVYVRIAAAGNLVAQAALAMLMTARGAALLAGQTLPPARTGADATRSIQRLVRLQGLPRGHHAWFDDLAFLFVWTAAVLQLLLLFDPRYRDFPFNVFAVPLVCVIARAALRDLPLNRGGREELGAGGALALGAVASAVLEGAANLQALGWTACALILATPTLLRVTRRAWWRVHA
jgi:exo-beta-1,3-glucanase (GH17 family)